MILPPMLNGQKEKPRQIRPGNKHRNKSSSKAQNQSPNNSLLHNDSLNDSSTRSKVNTTLYTETEASIRKTVIYQTRFNVPSTLINQNSQNNTFAPQLRPRASPNILVPITRHKSPVSHSNAKQGNESQGTNSSFVVLPSVGSQAQEIQLTGLAANRTNGNQAGIQIVHINSNNVNIFNNPVTKKFES